VSGGGKDRRRRELAAIHIKAKEASLEREQYVELLQRVANVDSAADLDADGRKRVLNALSAILRSGGATCGETRSRLLGARGRDKAPLLRKIAMQLREHDRPDAYADAMAQHMYKVARVEWLKPDQLRGIVAALAIDHRRREARKIKTEGKAS
jgi:phage gp16-like protein